MILSCQSHLSPEIALVWLETGLLILSTKVSKKVKEAKWNKVGTDCNNPRFLINVPLS